MSARTEGKEKPVELRALADGARLLVAVDADNADALHGPGRLLQVWPLHSDAEPHAVVVELDAGPTVAVVPARVSLA